MAIPQWPSHIDIQFKTWLLIRWQDTHQPTRSLVCKSVSDFNHGLPCYIKTHFNMAWQAMLKTYYSMLTLRIKAILFHKHTRNNTITVWVSVNIPCSMVMSIVFQAPLSQLDVNSLAFKSIAHFNHEGCIKIKCIRKISASATNRLDKS